MHNRLLLSFLSVFVGPVKRCGLKNFGSLWRAAAVGVQTFQKRRTSASFWGCGMDANPIRVAPECHDTTGSCLSVSWHFWPMGILLEIIKEYMRKG
jgi:hypothetical protein